MKHPIAALFGEPVGDTVTISLKPQSDNYVRIVASEPNQFIKLTATNASKNNPIRVTVSDAPSGKEAKRYLDIHTKTSEVYKKYIQGNESTTED